MATSAHSTATERLAALGLDVTEWHPRPGSTPIPRVDPRTPELCAEALRFAAAERLRVLPAGDGTRLAQLPHLPRADFVLGTRQLTGVTDYESADGTLTARVGSHPAELAAHVAAGGHHFSPDVARPDTGTLGGLVAAGESGRDRLRYGPLRHHVLGAQVLLADGSRTRSGGKLVKNVTGYDLHRLYCGSFGSLAFLLEVSLRLFPLAESRRVVRAELPETDGIEAAEALERRALRPETLYLERSLDAGAEAGPWRLTVILAGRERVVAHELNELLTALPNPQVLGDPSNNDSARLGAALREARDGERPVGPHLELSALPGRARSLVEALGAGAERSGVTGALRVHTGVGSALFSPDPHCTAEQLALFHAEVVARSGDPRSGRTWRWRGVSPDAAALFLTAGPAPGPGPRALMERQRRALDPERRFVGRVPGLDSSTGDAGPAPARKESAR